VTTGVGGGGTQGDGGLLTLAGGAGGADGDGGSVAITAGASGGSDEDGGDVTITAGAPNGSGAPGRIILAGGGIVFPFVLKTGDYTCTKDDYAVSYTTSAIETNTLPDANTVLGQVFVIALYDDGGDLCVCTDATDTFDGGTGTKLIMDTEGQSVTVMATAANAYTIIQTGDAVLATITTQ